MRGQPELAQGATSEVKLDARLQDPITVEDGKLLFGADFIRQGPDLILRNEGADDIRIIDYFRSDAPRDLHSGDGAVLPGAWAEKLAGPIAPGQYAQAGGNATADVIGQVETSDGSASVQRLDGTEETLAEGSPIFLGDVVSTGRGGSLSITFVDGTIFSLSSNSRMVIDDLVYTPAGNQNSAAFNLIQGGFVFVAGQIAPTGGMEVSTPAATMGIRGTTVLAELRTEAGEAVSEISLTQDPETGDVGRILLFDRDGNLLAEVTRTDTKYIITSGGDVQEVLRDAEDEETDRALLEDLLEAFEQASIRVEQGGNFVELNGNAGEGTPSETGLEPDSPEGEGDEDVELDSQDEAPPEPEDAPEEPPTENETFDEGSLKDNDFIQTQTATLEVTSGAEDARGSVIEDQNTSTSGQLTATGEAVIWSGSSEGTLGSFQINEDGQWIYIVGEEADGLGEGQLVTEAFTAVATDGDGVSAQQQVVVSVTGTNDAPIVTSNPSAAQGTTTENLAPFASGTLVANDPDNGATLTWSGSAEGALGAFQISETGQWTYTANAAAENLADGQVETETFTATVTDDQGATATQQVTITVSGTNDAPIITSDTPPQIMVTEDSAPTATGQITATDVDAGTTLSFSAPSQTTYGSFAIDDQGAWTYTAGAAADQISGGHVVSETVTVTVTDGQGGSATQDIVITITGTNDTPILTTAPGANVGNIDLSVATTAQGQLTAIDPDAAGTLPDEEDPETPLLRLDAQEFQPTISTPAPSGTLVWSGSAEGTYGSFAIQENGVWIYTVGPSANIPEDQIVQDSFVATVVDDQGGTATETVTINLTGANATPVVIQSDTSGSVIENTSPIASGQLNASDADENDTLVWSGSAPGAFGSFEVTESGTWTYTLGPAAEALAEGQTASESFVATVTDDKGGTATETVQVLITGTNDVPIVQESDIDGEVTDSEGTTVSGQMNAVDADAGASLVWTGTASGELGEFEITEDGLWTYTVGPAAEDLTDGEFVSEVFQATVTDDTGATATESVEVVVLGTGSGPEVASAEFIYAEGETSGQLGAANPDPSNQLTYSLVNEASNGTVTLQSDGSFTYTPTVTVPGIDRFDYSVGPPSVPGIEASAIVLGQSEPLTLPNGDVVDLDLSRPPSGAAPAGHAILTQNSIDDPGLTIVLAFDTSDATTASYWNRLLGRTQRGLEEIKSALDTSEVPFTIHLVTYAATAELVGSFDQINDELLTAISELRRTEGETDIAAGLGAADGLLAETDVGLAYIFSESPLPASHAETDYTLVQYGFTSHISFEDTTSVVLDLNLADLIPDAVALQLISDGTDLGEIGNEADFTATLGENEIVYALAELPGIADLLGEENLFAFNAQVTSDLGAFELGASEVFAKADDVQSLQGTSGADLLFGSDANDSITAGEGSDIVLGFAGNDLIDAGTGADTIKAGDGDDTIRVDTSDGSPGARIEGGLGADVVALDGSQVDNALDAIDLSGIEALDITNVQIDNLNLSLADVLDMVQPADAELAELLESALPASVTIYGDGNDIVTLGPSATDTGQTTQDAQGNTFAVYTYSEGSDVLAQLAIDADVTVATQPATS